jgi:hypothetical protein
MIFLHICLCAFGRVRIWLEVDESSEPDVSETAAEVDVGAHYALPGKTRCQFGLYPTEACKQQAIPASPNQQIQLCQPACLGTRMQGEMGQHLQHAYGLPQPHLGLQRPTFHGGDAVPGLQPPLQLPNFHGGIVSPDGNQPHGPCLTYPEVHQAPMNKTESAPGGNDWIGRMLDHFHSGADLPA